VGNSVQKYSRFWETSILRGVEDFVTCKHFPLSEATIVGETNEEIGPDNSKYW
jgi:hypothetical protein